MSVKLQDCFRSIHRVKMSISIFLFQKMGVFFYIIHKWDAKINDRQNLRQAGIVVVHLSTDSVLFNVRFHLNGK